MPSIIIASILNALLILICLRSSRSQANILTPILFFAAIAEVSILLLNIILYSKPQASFLVNHSVHIIRILTWSTLIGHLGINRLISSGAKTLNAQNALALLMFVTTYYYLDRNSNSLYPIILLTFSFILMLSNLLNQPLPKKEILAKIAKSEEIERTLIVLIDDSPLFLKLWQIKLQSKDLHTFGSPELFIDYTTKNPQFLNQIRVIIADQNYGKTSELKGTDLANITGAGTIFILCTGQPIDINLYPHVYALIDKTPLTLEQIESIIKSKDNK